MSFEKLVKRNQLRFRVMRGIDEFFITLASFICFVMIILYIPLYLLTRKDGDG